MSDEHEVMLRLRGLLDQIKELQVELKKLGVEVKVDIKLEVKGQGERSC